MKLEAGLKAPDFAGESLKGGMVSLETFQGRNLLLQFHRFASCLPCNLHLRGLMARSEDLSGAGITPIVFVHSPTSSMEKYQIPDMSNDDLPFDIVADPDKRIFRAYGVEASWTGLLSWNVVRQSSRAISAGLFTTLKVDGGLTGLPAGFLVDGGGVIRHAHYGKTIADLPTVDEILKISRSLWPRRRPGISRT